MKILVIGAGMYVTGRYGTGEGTILASLAQASCDLKIERVDIIARNPLNENIIKDATDRINQRIGANLITTYHSISSVKDYLNLNSDYDAAIIAVPDHIHYEIAREVIEKHLHCLIVKPLTNCLSDAQDLVRIQQQNGVYGAVEFHKRFDESNRLIRRYIEDNAIGVVKYFVINYSQRLSIPLEVFKEWSTKTNIFQYLGVHYVDLVYYLTGAIPERVMAIGTMGVLSEYGINTFDSIHAIIQWRVNKGNDSFITVMNISWIDPYCTSALSDQKFLLVGSSGIVNADQKNRGIELIKDGIGIQHPNPYFSDYLPKIDGGLEFQGYGYRSIRRFLDDIHELKSGSTTIDRLDMTRPSFRQALVSTAVIDAVNKSIKQSSKWVDINDIY
jgi:predicted dehydrogenase